MSLCDDCFKVVLHEGTPSGTETQIGGIPCYVGTPSGDYKQETALLFLSDAFGIGLINSKLLVDSLATNGFKTVGVDFFLGDGAPLDAVQPNSTFDRAAWFGRNALQNTRPRIDAVIAGLKEQGVTRLGVVGFCYGGKHAIDLAVDNAVAVAVSTHPGMLDVPGDFEKLIASSKAPLLLNTAEVDEYFPPEQQARVEELLGGGKYAPGYERTHWAGCTHGFAVRGDLSDPKVKEGKEGTFKATVAFFQKYL